MSILLTGGAGFIGVHMAAKLLSHDMKFLVVDNLSNSDMTQLEKLEVFFKKKITFLNCDIRDSYMLKKVFSENEIESVVHFAGLKSVSESVKNSQLYFNNNVLGSKNLLDLVKKYKIKKFIFSSSATVYGEPKYLPIDEGHTLNATNPYAQNKIDIENLMKSDSFFSDKCCTKILRYFNPVGALENGLIGEVPRGVPNNLVPYLLGVINGDYPYLKVYGDDYDTPDGSPIRDYIHIMDLIDAHFLALQDTNQGVDILNVGNGMGHSVIQIIKIFERTNNIKIPIKIMSRRKGDVESSYADNKKIIKKYNWKAKRGIDQICRDAYQFSQNQNL
ncbi:UDP-glucose 4-epimerase GalE [Methylophilaceae bacterium]|nr:UDP-glucose 4-epimerase GalE [Methylophilaceae bacterium]